MAAVAVPGVAVLAHAVVASLGVDAVGVDVAVVLAGAALVQLGAVELVHSAITGEAFAGVGSGGVDAAGVLVAVVAFEAALLLAFVDIYRKNSVTRGIFRRLSVSCMYIGSQRWRTEGNGTSESGSRTMRQCHNASYTIKAKIIDSVEGSSSATLPFVRPPRQQQPKVRKKCCVPVHNRPSP